MLPEGARERLRIEIDDAVGTRFASRAGLARAAEIKPTTLQQIYEGDGDVGSSLMYRLCAALGVSVDFILTGEAVQSAGSSELVHVPVHDISVSAGGGAVAIDRQHAMGFWPFPEAQLADMNAPADHLHVLPVKGDSMAPTLNDGDWVMINRARTDWVDGIYVVRFYDDLFVKRLQFEGRQIRMVSDNDNYRTIEIERSNEADISAFELIGRVIWKAGAI